MAALSGHTVFTSYILVPTGSSLGYGYSKSIHCNYIKSISFNVNPYQQEIIMNFASMSDWKFLSDNINNGTGYTVNRIYALVQVVSNSGFTEMSDIRPTASQWRIYELTNQILTHGIGTPLTADFITGQAFKISLKDYFNTDVFPIYKLSDYIKYPTKQPNADNELCFGDETFFLGNVSTNIKAIAYTLDVPIILNLNEFNSSTNATWNKELDKVVITEIGIYDTQKNLVAIGKLNNPIQKDNSIARTIVFDVDF